jgi:hypothetical protein
VPLHHLLPAVRKESDSLYLRERFFLPSRARGCIMPGTGNEFRVDSAKVVVQC